MSLKKIRERLEDLYLNKPKQLDELLNPVPVPCAAPANLVIAYPGFIKWLAKYASELRPHIEEGLKSKRDYALRSAVDKYQHKKKLYEEQVERVLRHVGRYEVGIAVFNEIRKAGKKTGQFKPYHDDKDPVNADVWSEDDAAATQRGMPIYDNDYKVHGSGMGTGSNVTIDYSQDFWGFFNNLPRGTETLKGPASADDEVLLHELVHAGRQMTGASYSMPVSGKYDDEEEYLAVVIANIYLSNKKLTVFRKNHKEEAPLDDPDHFLDSKAANLRPRVLLERLYLQQRTLYDALAAISEKIAPFNPVRWYEQEQKKAGKH